ncbi:hypothetical protein BHU09_05375 [Tannerella sp. oral taxon 808]|nr:hypothetical protein BHU09_05375 [Tannerella sp. oral taxon 808]
MRLKTIEIRDFKCFEKYKVDFVPSVTVFIGRNGAGKTALISAIHKVLSFIFSSDKSLGDDFLSAGNPSLKVNTFDESDYHRNDEKGTITNDLSIHAEAVYADQLLTWKLYKRTAGRAALYTSKYKDAFRQFMSAYQGGADLPLLAYYSDSFPHRNTKLTKFAFDMIRLERIPRNFGYYQWDMEAACTTLWEVRMANQLSQMNPLYTPALRVSSEIMELEDSQSPEQLAGNERYQELKEEEQRLTTYMTPLYEETHFVESKLKTFVSKLSTLERDGYNIDYLAPFQAKDGLRISLRFSNKNTLSLQDLPAGYRRLYSIVFDMAYRTYILNGDKEPAGIVVIDEIDLHLHPSLEQEVVAALHATFPEVQFIISTHSAAVISNLNAAKRGDEEPANRVLLMEEGQTQPETLRDIYGLDYNATLQDFMGAPISNREIDQLKDEYLTFRSLGLGKKAESTIKRLEKFLGRTDHPILEELRKEAEEYEVYR